MTKQAVVRFQFAKTLRQPNRELCITRINHAQDFWRPRAALLTGKRRIEFYDKRSDTGEGYFVDLYLAESFGGGESWEPNIRLSEFSSDIRSAPVDPYQPAKRFLGHYQSMAPSLNFETPAVAVWIDTRNGNNDPYAVCITRTRGTTFDTWRKLRWGTNDLANSSEARQSLNEKSITTSLP